MSLLRPHQGVFQSRGFSLDALHEAPRPYKLSRKQTQAHEDHGGAWPRSENHNDSEGQQGEPCKNQKNSSNLPNRAEDH
jgi:hypothetical protein